MHGVSQAMAELGTPENPEIILPGERPAAKAQNVGPRWQLAFSLVRVIFSVTLPAVGLDLLFAWIFQIAVNNGGALPWLGLMLLGLPVLILTLIAIAANLILWPALILILSGKATQMPNFKFINVRR